MAYSYNEVTGTGVSQLIPVPEYVDQAHIFVSINGVNTTTFSWVNPNTVSVTAAVGSKVRVYRSTSPSERVVDYMDGQSLTEAVLDADSKQAFFLAQEQLDATNEAVVAYGGLASTLTTIQAETAESAANAAAAAASEATVLANKPAIDTVAANAAAVAAVAANEVNINAVAANKPAIDTVAGAITPVQTVATNIADVQAAVAALPALATKVSKTSDTGAAALPHGPTSARPLAPEQGHIRVNDDLNKAEVFIGGAWGSVGGGATGGGSDTVFQENSTVVTENYTVPAGKNAMTVGPLSINTGKAITVSSGQRLVVL